VTEVPGIHRPDCEVFAQKRLDHRLDRAIEAALDDEPAFVRPHGSFLSRRIHADSVPIRNRQEILARPGTTMRKNPDARGDFLARTEAAHPEMAASLRKSCCPLVAPTLPILA
jgi:hypothetical protein